MAGSIIEQAVRRLEELKRSGVEVPAPRGPAAATPAAPTAAPEEPAIEPATVPAAVPLSAVPRQAAAAVQPAQPPKVSRRVNIDLAALARTGYLTPDAPRSRLAEEFRVIKRPLLKNTFPTEPNNLRRPQLLMVTSSVPGEGKTFVSVNLAMSLAMELDTTVLLVDADVSRPSVLKRLGLPSEPGLLDLLTDPAMGLSDVILRTNVDKLTLLPAGRSHGRATEILASESMNRLLDELASRYHDRVIVFDAPPVLASTESRVLATRVGQVVFVVESEKTPQRTVAQAMAALENCQVVMPMLNKVSTSDVGEYYGYYEPTVR